MPAPNLPGQVVQDLLYCLGLGVLLGLVRLLFPYRWRLAADIADFVCVGLGMILLQSYAVGMSRAGVFRWYMLVSAGAGLWAVETLFLPMRQRLDRKTAHRIRKRQERPRPKRKKHALSGKKHKKQLQKNQRVLYNSSV